MKENRQQIDESHLILSKVRGFLSTCRLPDIEPYIYKFLNFKLGKLKIKTCKIKENKFFDFLISFMD